MASVVNERDFAAALVKVLDGPVDNEDILKAVASWLRQESGSHIIRNNPYNMTFVEGFTGYTGMEGGFSTFDSLTSGIISTAHFLTVFPAGDWRGYAQIVEALQSGDAARFMQCLAQSAWDAARYGTLTGGPNHIVNVFDTFGAFRDVSVEPGPLGADFPSEPTPPPTPEPPPPPTPEPPPAANTYTVVSGDTLWSIAEKLLGDGKLWPAIFDANRDQISDPNLIYPGQVLDIPAPAPHPTPPDKRTYTVQAGDSLWAIAEKVYGDPHRWPDIYRANAGRIGSDPSLIHPGQVLVIP